MILSCKSPYTTKNPIIPATHNRSLVVGDKRLGSTRGASAREKKEEEEEEVRVEERENEENFGFVEGRKPNF